MSTTITGTAGNDNLANSGTGVTINALAGNDSITDNGSDSTIDGGDGNDRLVLYRTGSTAFTMTFTGGGTTAQPASDLTTVVNVEHIALTTGAGNDSVTFADLTYDNVWQGNSWNAGGGVNTATVDLSDTSTDIDISNSSATSSTFHSYALGGNFLTLSNVQNLVIKLGSGSGNVDLSASTANNTITGGTDQTIIFTGSGDDLIYTVAGTVYSTVGTGAGNDTIYGGAGDDYIDGGTGNDTIDGGAGNDTAQYAAATGAITLDLNLTTAQAVGGGQGTDTVLNIENITASAYNDSLTGNAANNLIDGWGGSDTIAGGDGNDTLYGLANSVLDGGNGDDVIYNPAEGAVTIRGGTGNDAIWAFGNLTADDQIDGGSGSDALHLSGDTTVAFTATTVIGIEDIVLDAWANYHLTTADATVALGDTLTIDGSALQASDTLIFGGRAETDASFNLIGGAGADTLTAGGEHDTLTGGAGNDALDGGANIDTAVFAGSEAAYTITQTSTGNFTVVGPDGTDTLTNIEYTKFDDATMRLLPGSGTTIDWSADPSTYMAAIRDFDGNNLGGTTSWKLIGTADVNGDGTAEHILFNREIGRWAEVATEADGKSYFANNAWAGDTRVVGIYIDPLVTLGIVQAGSDFDSQRRFQNDLQIDNIHGVLGEGDYNKDGLQEIYFSLTDGTAYLHAYMHADGNIQYANYQNQAQVIDYLTSNGVSSSTWANWFPAAQTTLAAVPS